MRKIDQIADQYVDDVLALSPMTATFMGLPGSDHLLDDLSTEGDDKQAELARRTIADLEATEPVDERERVAKEAMLERLRLQVERHDEGDAHLSLNVLTSGVHDVRQIFDLMPHEGEAAAANVAARLAAVPDAFAQYTELLRAEAAAGRVAAKRQVLEVARHCDNWNGAGGDDFWQGLVDRVLVDGEPVTQGKLKVDLSNGTSWARWATTKFAAFLRDELAPQAPEKDAVGRDRYSRASRYFIGAEIDLEETYAWGWQELARIKDDMEATARKIDPDATLAETVAALDSDGEQNMTDKAAFRDWMQSLADETIADLADEHFDIPEQVRRIDCKIAPTEDGAIYYTGPSEDFVRPGAMWWSVPGDQTSFSKWREKSTIYHEGVPGHHLQIGQAATRSNLLNRFQRTMLMSSGHAEGWALYSERLMDELGYYDDDPAGRLGMLDAQAMRAVRVVVDIGLHCEFEIPSDNPFGWRPGEQWDGEKMLEFMREHIYTVEDAMLVFERNRYLGWPGQAPSYKVGERLWMQAREDYRERKGADYRLKDFHTEALNLGPMGLAPFAEALKRL